MGITRKERQGVTPSGNGVRTKKPGEGSRPSVLCTVGATKGSSDCAIGTMTGERGFGMVKAMNESLLAFTVVVVAAIGFVALITVAFVPLAFRLLQVFT